MNMMPGVDGPATVGIVTLGLAVGVLLIALAFSRGRRPARRAMVGEASTTSSPEFSIDRSDGSLTFGGIATVSAGDGREWVEATFASRVQRVRDHQNGFVWLELDGLSFGGHPCFVGLCFFQGQLTAASWSVALPGATRPGEGGGWPTREEMNAEVKFIIGVLADQVGGAFLSGMEVFAWGRIWSRVSAKGGMADSGLQYN